MRLTLFAASMLLFFSSCKKDLSVNHNLPDGLVTHESTNDAAAANEFSNCKLRRIVHENPFVSETTVNCLFTYNAAGNPVSLIHTGPLVVNTSGYNTLNYYFYYDKKNRLKKLFVNFTEDPSKWNEYTEEHRYGYNDAGVIIVDTTFAHWRDDFADLTPKRISQFTYDSYGRVVKENIQDFYWGTTRNPTYTYDARGNLGVIGWKSSGYDNKVSIFRAHPLFQFIHRNYSRNNALSEAAYNSGGLPLSVGNLNDDFFGASRINPSGPANPFGGIIRAVYDCQ